MKIVVTGASGHLGANLVRELIRKNILPRVLVYDDVKALREVDVEQVQGDVRDIESLKRCFDGADLVYHLAAKISIMTHDEVDVRATNVDGTRNVVSACLASGVRRLVHVSSIHAFNPHPANESVDETRPLIINDGFPYDRSKADGAREVELGMPKGLEVVTVFPTSLIGPYDFKVSRMGRFFLDFYHGKLPMLINGGFNFVDIRDVASGIITAADRGKNGERYLMGGHYMPIHHLGALVGKITGKKAPKMVFPIKILQAISPVVSLYARMMRDEGLQNAVSPVTLETLRSYRDVCSDKSSRELNFCPRPLEETIESIYAWFGEVGYLKRK